MKKQRTSFVAVSLATLLATGLSSSPLAAEAGRYQAITLLEGGRMGGSGSLQPRVLILDTQEGLLWTWEENVRLDGPGKGGSFGTAIIYQGRVKPGTRVGEVIDQAGRP